MIEYDVEKQSPVSIFFRYNINYCPNDMKNKVVLQQAKYPENEDNLLIKLIVSGMLILLIVLTVVAVKIFKKLKRLE